MQATSVAISHSLFSIMVAIATARTSTLTCGRSDKACLKLLATTYYHIVYTTTASNESHTTVTYGYSVIGPEGVYDELDVLPPRIVTKHQLRYAQSR